MTSKLTGGKFWQDDPSEMYILADHRHTEALALDLRNDPTVKSIKSVDATDSIDVSDWAIGRNYALQSFETYVKALGGVLSKKVSVVVLPGDERDGYIGRLRVLKPDYGLIDYFQATTLEDLSFDMIEPDATEIPLRSTSTEVLECLPVERITATKQHTPILLSYFFSGLKQDNPLKSYVSFYNVLECYFEEAPRLLGEEAKTELEQLRCVLDLTITDADLQRFLLGVDHHLRKAIGSDMQTSSGVVIRGLSPTTANITQVARWLYEIRCSIVHSKKTRKGKSTSIFEPYSAASNNVNISLPSVKWLSILCIEKDHSLRTGSGVI